MLFFDRRPGAKEPWTKSVWVYDLRTNKHFTLKTKRMTRADLDEFVECYRAADRHNRKATWSEATPEGRWRPYTYEEILARDKVSHAHVYRARVTREEFHRGLIGGLVQDLLSQHAESVVTAFVDVAERAGPETLDRLEALIAERRRERGEKKR